MKQIGIWVGVIAIFAATTWGLIALVNSKNSGTSSQISAPTIAYSI